MTIFRNILAVLAGILVGSIVNGAIISLSDKIASLPEGFDNSTIEAMTATIHLLEPKHFVWPFLAHAIGTLVGAFIAALVAASHKMVFAMVIGFVFLAGGIYMVTILPSPRWFNVVDVVGAYLPFAFIGGKLGGPRKVTN